MFAEDFNRATVECIHFLEPSQFPDRSELAKLGLHIAEISAKRIKTKADLLDAIAEAMNFPAYFGKNWDALEDCLRDLEWISAKGYALLIHHSQPLWKNGTRLAGQLVESWLSCNDFWLTQKVPFHMVFELDQAD